MTNSYQSGDAFKKSEGFAGRWSGRSRWDRTQENIWEQNAITNIEDFLTNSGINENRYVNYSEAAGVDLNTVNWMQTDSSNWESKANKYDANIHQRDNLMALEEYLSGTDWGALGYEGTAYERGDEYSGDWNRNRSMHERMAENQYQQGVIENIENFLGNLQAYTEKEDYQKTIEDIQEGNTNAFTEELERIQEENEVVGSWQDEIGPDVGMPSDWDQQKKAWEQELEDWSNKYAQLERESQLASQSAAASEAAAVEAERIRLGELSDADRTTWETDAASERAEFNRILEQQGITNQAEIDRLTTSFAQQQEISRLSEQLERKTLESSIRTEYETKFEEEQKDTKEYYDTLISNAATEHEAELIEQAKFYELREQEKAGYWADKEQEWSKKQDVYQGQIDASAAELGEATSSMEKKQRAWDYEREAWSKDLDEKEKVWSESQQEWKKEREGFAGEREAWDEEKGEWQKQESNYEEALRVANEQVIQAEERARVAANYGTQGKSMNQEVQNVRMRNESIPIQKMARGTRGSFNRKGMRIKNLNV